MGHFEEPLSGPEKLSQKLKNSNYYSQIGDIKVKVDPCKEGGIEIKIGTHRQTNGDNLENSNWVPNLSEIRKKLNSRDFSISSEFENVGLDNLPTPHCNCPACVTLMESLMSSILKQQSLAETTDPGKPCAEWTASALKNLNLNDHVDLSQIPPHALYEHIQSQYQQNQKKATTNGMAHLPKDRPIPLSDKVENISPNIEGPQTAAEKYPYINFKPCQRLTHGTPSDTAKEGPEDSPGLKRKSSSSVMVKIGTSHGSLTISSKKKIICQKTTEISTQTAQDPPPPQAVVSKKEECVAEQKKTESEIKKAGCQGTHAAEGCSEDHSDSSSKTKFCACCYCELVGHSGPQAPPNTHNYEQIKEKLRKKLEKRFPNDKGKKEKEVLEQSTAPLDDRPVEDLMAFIEGGEREKKTKKKKKSKVVKEETKPSEEVCSESCADSKASRKRERTPDRWELEIHEYMSQNMSPVPYVNPSPPSNPPQSSSLPPPILSPSAKPSIPSPPPAVLSETKSSPEPLDEFSEQLNKFRHLPQEKKLELLCNKKFERKLVENIYNYQQQLLRSIQAAKAEEVRVALEAESQGEAGKKKNKKKKKRNETVDDIFMPRIDLDEVEILDENERELENFKKFCMDKQPKPQRQKIQLNIKNLNGKK